MGSYGWYGSGVLLMLLLGLGINAVFDRPHHHVRGTFAVDGEGDAASLLTAWGAREDDHPAPPLRLRLAATDLGDWWWSEESTPKPQDDGDGLKAVYLELSLPSAGGFEAAGLDPLCADDPVPFAGCRIGRASLELQRDDNAWDERDILLGEKAPPAQDQVPYDQRKVLLLASAWLRRGRGGTPSQVLGWDCDSLPEGIAPAEALRLDQPDPRLGCYRPPGLRRFHPAWFGLERHNVYFECGSNACKAWFLYQGRIASLDAYGRRGAEVRPLAAMLFVTAWQMLERARLDAAALPAGRLLEEGRQQALACKAITAEALRRELGRGNTRQGIDPNGWNVLPCVKAGRLGMVVAGGEPAQALPLLDAALPGLEALDGSYALRERLQQARIEAYRTSGQEQSPALLQALYDYGSHLTLQSAQREPALRQAWELVLKLDTQVPAATRDGIAQALGQTYSIPGNDAAAAAVYRQWTGLLERAEAPAGLQLRALISLAFAQNGAGDFASLRLTAERMGQLYLGRAERDWAGVDGAECGTEGVYAVAFYTSYALHEKAFAEVEAPVAQLVARISAEQGPDSRYTRAAQFHQGEVLNRKGIAGMPIGGGFLGQ
jgi:hypothetical protein